MKRGILWLVGFLFAATLLRANDDPFGQLVRMPKFKGSTYEALNTVSKLSGVLFIYDSKIIDNERKVKIDEGDMTLRQAILKAVNTSSIDMKIIGRHVLLYQREPVEVTTLKRISPSQPAVSFIIAEGTVRDKESKEPLAFASVSLEESSLGNVTNQNGFFQLKIPDSLQHANVRISYLGYKPCTVPATLLASPGNNADIYLETSVIPLQEVIIRLVNPEKIVRDMLEQRPENYAKNPAYLTVFYREGIDYKKGLVNLTEGVFKIYKSPFCSEEAERAKLLKMRKISSNEKNDTLVVKLKAGVYSALNLDVVKTLPDFFVMDAENPYHYTKVDMTEMDGRLAHVVTFEQKQGLNETAYKGTLFIDAENAALLQAEFEVDPRYIQRLKNTFVVRQSKQLNVIPRQARYYVSYKAWNGTYYLNYVRGELNFEVARKNRLFNRTSMVNAYFEMAVCKIDTVDVKRFPNRESIATRNVFSETHFMYDALFWDDFNIIPPEEWLNKAIEKISAKIEENEE